MFHFKYTTIGEKSGQMYCALSLTSINGIFVILCSSRVEKSRVDFRICTTQRHKKIIFLGHIHFVSSFVS